MKKSLSDNPCVPQPWWLIAGNNLTGDVLFAGKASDGDICLLKEISHFLTLTNLAESANEAADRQYDAIILSAGTTQDPDIVRNAANILYGHLKNTGVLIVYGCKVNIRGKTVSSPADIFMPCLAYTDFPSEAFVAGHYTSNKNTGLFKEKIKKLIFNTPLCRYFIHNYLQAFGKSAASRNLLTELPSTLSRASLPVPDDNHILSKIIFKYGKLIVIYTNTVVVVAANQYTRAQRENEINIIGHLRKNSSMNKFLVSYITESEACSFTVYIMENVHGNTVDINCKNIHAMINNAYSVIRTMSVNSIKGHYTEEQLEAKLNVYFRDFNARLMQFGLSIGNDTRNFSKRLAGIPIVCMHGDLKLENFVLDRHHAVKRIIDWELSDREGLPLLDLYFFVTYNIAILFFDGMLKLENTGECFTKTLDKGPLAPFRNMLDDYAKALDINDEQANLLFTVYVIHHFAYRLFIVDNSPRELERLGKIINTFIQPTLEAIREQH